MGIAVSKLAFPVIGQAYEITYPLAVPAAAAVAVAPVVPYVVAQPLQPVQPVVYQDESWKTIYKAGTGKIIGGAVMLGLGGVFSIVGIAVIGVGASMNTDTILYSSDAGVPYMAAGAVVLTLGLVFVAVGGAKLGRGKYLRNKALQMRGPLAAALVPEVAFGPLSGGGALSLTWNF